MPNHEEDDQQIVYTIGHSNLNNLEFIKLLTLYKINLVIDVRSVPYSKFIPQYNRENVSQTLNSFDISYKYAGEFLGGRPKNPDCYKNRKLPEKNSDYLQVVDYSKMMTTENFLVGINTVIKYISQYKVAIMCSEENPADCHRHYLIGRYLYNRGYKVLHIRHDGNVVKDQHLPNKIKELSHNLTLF